MRNGLCLQFSEHAHRCSQGMGCTFCILSMLTDVHSEWIVPSLSEHAHRWPQDSISGVTSQSFLLLPVSISFASSPSAFVSPPNSFLQTVLCLEFFLFAILSFFVLFFSSKEPHGFLSLFRRQSHKEFLFYSCAVLTFLFAFYGNLLRLSIEQTIMFIKGDKVTTSFGPV